MIVFYPLGVFWVMRTLRTLIDTYKAVWLVLPLVLGITACASTGVRWYYGIGVAGASVLIEAVEGLLVVKSDESLRNVLRSRR